MLCLSFSIQVQVQIKPKFRYFGFGSNNGFGRSLVLHINMSARVSLNEFVFCSHTIPFSTPSFKEKLKAA